MKKTTVSILLAAAATFAHPGHGGALSGFAHPLTGFDHMAAMVAVGVLAARRAAPGTGILGLPVLFASALAIGALPPSAGMSIPLAEPAILASVLLLGAILLFDLRLPNTVLVPLVGGFGIAHGFAHGAESGGITASFLAGCVASTVALHAAGAAAALWIGTRRAAIVWGGASAAVFAAFGMG